ncbi:MAG: TIR domain-containing protein [Clostridia bacterium]|nr:TIR domain-containing protein [Clostridia bacterium]
MSFYCKNCGTELNVDGQKIAVCDFCGMEQTLPTADDPKKLELFAKANEYRMASRFDIAKKQYESIIEQYPEENEAYWCKILCEYGIEYVEDILTEKNLPTCHRTIRESIFDNKDYKLIMSRATAEEKAIYETEAKEIDRIQKEILVKADKEEPYDIFICYKETELDGGKRTVDAQHATKIYTYLTEYGYKVFFSRITLKNKLGSEYEPVIYSALKSAKVMLHVTTSVEHTNAPWVRNEWSRFLEFAQSDVTKTILPCIAQMGPYELPEELSRFQVADMTDLDFYENLLLQINKKFGGYVETKKAEPVAVSPIRTEQNPTQTGNNATIQPLLKRINIFLINSEWDKADEYAEKVLDTDPECAEAYLGKLLSELKLKNKEQLKDCANPFDNSKHYQMLMMFANETLKQEIKGYIDYIKERNENARKQGIYEKATSLMLSAKTESEYKEAGTTFGTIKGYKDAQALANECYDKAEEIRKNAIYEKAKREAKGSNIINFESAIDIYKSIINWKDSKAQIEYCNKRIAEIKAKIEATKQKNKMCGELVKSLATAKSKEAIEEIRKEAQSNLNKLESKRKELDKIKEKLPAVQLQIEDVDKEIKELESKINALRAERATLGFFAMKRKKEIDSEIKALERGEKEKATKKETLKQELKGHVSISSIEKDIEKYDKQIEEAKEEIEKNKTLLTKDEIVAELYKTKTGKQMYESSAEYKKDLVRKELSKAKVGATVKFGKYYQSNDKTKEDIEWQVLAREGNKALLISKYALDRKQYNMVKKDVTWETCSLRKWLNNNFLNSAFSNEEKSFIPTVTVSADNNSSFSANPGNTTQDEVFLLSIFEANKYFSSKTARQCKPTAYANKNIAWINSDNGNCWWWLRSPGFYQYDAAIVYNDGDVDYDGRGVDHDYYAVRPALWVDLES